jgi:hypothetical protein
VKKILTFFLFFVLLGLAKLALADPIEDVTPTGIGFSMGVWVSPNFSGFVKAGAGGTLISLRDNLGLANQTFLVPEIWWRFSHGQILDFRYSQMNETVTQTLSAPQTFEGIFFPSGQPATTHLELQWGDLSYELPIYYDTFPPQKDYLNVVADLKILRGVFTITNGNGSLGEHNPIAVPFPELGLHGKFRVGDGTALEFKTTGIFAGFEDAVGYSYDLEGGVTQFFGRNVELGAKYRNFTFYNRDASGNIFSFRFYGPELDAKVYF